MRLSKQTNALFIVACKVFGSLIRQLFPLLSLSLRFTEVSKVFAGRRLPTPDLDQLSAVSNRLVVRYFFKKKFETPHLPVHTPCCPIITPLLLSGRIALAVKYFPIKYAGECTKLMNWHCFKKFRSVLLQT